MSEANTTALETALDSALALFRIDDRAARHRLALRLAELARPVAPPAAQNLLGIASRFLEGSASGSELTEAKQDAWTALGSIACYCSANDSLSLQIVLAAIDDSEHDRKQLLELLDKLEKVGIEEVRVRAVLEETRA